MDTFFTDLIKQISPEFWAFVFAVIGALLAKLAGIIRAWGLGRKVAGGAQAATESVLALKNQGVIDARLAGVLIDAVAVFNLNAAQIHKAIADGLAKFGQDLQSSK